MAYSLNVPDISKPINQNGTPIVTNFNVINTIFAKNHVTFDNATVANRGKHTYVTMIEGADPITAVNEIAIYCKDLGGISTQYLRKENNGTIIQMSGADPVTGGNDSSGQTFLPGGIILKWASAIISGAGTPVLFAPAFPNNCFIVILSGFAAPGHAFGYSALTNTGFTGWGPAGSGALSARYIAIGN